MVDKNSERIDTKNHAETIMITTECTAKCAHCPFSIDGLPKLELSPEEILKIIVNSKQELIVLSGGEPFLHSKISRILESLSEVNKPLRIATGGFFDLSIVAPFLTQVKSLKGVSMGTDVLTSTHNLKGFKNIWLKNLKTLENLRIPYSLTITLQENLNNYFEIINFLKSHKINSQFVYLRFPKSTDAETLKMIKRDFPETYIYFDEIA
jgi:MoaA/NifB/PqqE/SkfB family radical SAM enzyme